MGKAKEITVRPITRDAANATIRRTHYSGKIVNNSQLHLGVFIGGKLEGAMQFGPSLDKRKIQPLVADTLWNDFIELNRMGFSDALPRNSESRAIAVAMRLIRKHYPNIKWVVSFSDAAQCGDGAIYRASGFVLTGIKKNTQIIEFPDGLRETRLNLTEAGRAKRSELAKRYGIKIGGGSSLKPFFKFGCKYVEGYQMRYIYFIDKAARSRLSVPEIDFSKIEELGAQMYKGVPMREKQAMTSPEAQRRGSADLHAPD